MTRGERLRLIRTARGLELGVLAERADVTRNGLWGIEAGRSEGREITLDAIAEALKVPRAALDDDAECIREICRIGNVPLPNAGPTLEGELAQLWERVPPDVRPGLVTMIRGLVAVVLTGRNK